MEKYFDENDVLVNLSDELTQLGEQWVPVIDPYCEFEALGDRYNCESRLMKVNVL